ncbi:hypothetical protein C8J56DRAFT_1059256 [Mycena floridula]|nr:hypothetical protein C8J56DRAFT_1059256 [Mycena floridula]
MNLSEQAGIDLFDTFGPIYWGFVVSLLLGGMTVVQAYVYFPSSNDRHIVKATAAMMLLLDICSSALVAQSICYYLLPHFGSLLPLNSVTPELSAECLLSTIITLISQLYFVYQLYVVRHLGQLKLSLMLLAFISLFAFLAFAGGIACVTTMYIFHHGVLSHRNHVFAIFFGFAKGSGAICDLVATVSMSIFLKSSRTGMDQTNIIIDSLIQFVIQRGVLVTCIQVLLLVTFYALPNSLVWFAFHVNVTKLYANTFFAMLNGRDRLKESATKTAFNSNSSGSVRSRRSKLVRESYNLRTLESQLTTTVIDDSKNFQMPAVDFPMPVVTRTVVISDL